MYYLIKFKNTEYKIPNDNLRLFAMTIGIFSSTTEECIKKLRHQGIEVSDFNELIKKYNREIDLLIDELYNKYGE